MSHDVFISYASQDKSTADAICNALEQKRIRCWIAPRDVLPGHIWASSDIPRGKAGESRYFEIVVEEINQAGFRAAGMARRRRHWRSVRPKGQAPETDAPPGFASDRELTIDGAQFLQTRCADVADALRAHLGASVMRRPAEARWT